MKRFWLLRGIGIFFIILGAISLFSFVVMSLWNTILVPVLHISVVNFWQALGILALSKILFGGFPGRRHHGHRGHPGLFTDKKWRGEMHEKWRNMTPEEKQKFKENWRDRCRNWKAGMENNYTQPANEKAE